MASMDAVTVTGNQHPPRRTGRQSRAPYVRCGHVPYPTEQATAVAEFPEPPKRPSADQTPDRCGRQRRETQVVRERAAGVVAAVGPAALEIIAEFRARNWAWTARFTDDPVSGERANARSVEWRRIATSVSILLALGRDE